MKPPSQASSRELIGLLEREKVLAKPKIKRSGEIECPELIAGLPNLPSEWAWASPAQIAAAEPNALTIGPFGSNLTVADYRTDGVPLVFVRNIRANDFERDLVYVTPAKAKELDSHSVSSGDVLITKMGDPPGDAVMYPSNRPKAIITADCIKLRISKLLDTPSFFVHAIHSRVVVQQIAKQTGGVAQQKVSLERFRSIALPFPPLPEQRKIADILTTCDVALETLDALIVAKNRQKHALMQQLLTGKTRVKGAKGKWKKVQLGELAENRSDQNKGKLGTELLYGVTKADGVVPMRDHVKGESFHRCKLLEHDWFAYNPMRINIGSIARWQGEKTVMVSGDYVVFRCFEDRISPAFLDHLRQSWMWHSFVTRGGNGSVRIRIYFSDLAEFNFPCPPIEEQLAIAAILDSADQELTLLRTQRQNLDKQKRGLMQRLLTGKVRVKVPTK